MPCRDDGPTPEELVHSRKVNGQFLAEQQEKRDKLTRMLCEAMSLLDDSNVDAWSEELFNWWTEHKEADRRRAEREEFEQFKTLFEKFKHTVDCDGVVGDFYGIS